MLWPLQPCSCSLDFYYEIFHCSINLACILVFRILVAAECGSSPPFYSYHHLSIDCSDGYRHLSCFEHHVSACVLFDCSSVVWRSYFEKPLFFSMNYVHISFVDHHTYVNKNNLFMKARKQISTLFTCWLLFSSLLISQHFSNYASGLHQVYTHSGNIEAITNWNLYLIYSAIQRALWTKSWVH